MWRHLLLSTWHLPFLRLHPMPRTPTRKYPLPWHVVPHHHIATYAAHFPVPSTTSWHLDIEMVDNTNKTPHLLLILCQFRCRPPLFVVVGPLSPLMLPFFGGRRSSNNIIPNPLKNAGAGVGCCICSSERFSGSTCSVTFFLSPLHFSADVG